MITPLTIIPCLGLVAALNAAPVAPGPINWWPAQHLPASLVRIDCTAISGPERERTEMLAESVAGLAAQAVNRGGGDQLVWVATGNEAEERWRQRFLSDHPLVRDLGARDLWTLIGDYAKAGMIKGYIVYRADHSKEEPKLRYRREMDVSVNIATSLAGVLHGVIVDEKVESVARAHGLARLEDARDKSQQWCFDTFKDRFTRGMLCTQDPRKPNARDYAIAQAAFTVYGQDPVVEQALRWLEPLAPILGWNGGDEFQTTRQATELGHFETCTDWVQNLPVLMAGATETAPARVPHPDPRQIDWKDRRSTVSFVNSDGDNVQWFESAYFGQPAYWWENPRRGQIPFGWTAPLTHASQLFPQALEYAVATATPNDSFIEWHSGYYYPDLFAAQLPDRWKYLAEHARRSWAQMRRDGTNVIGFNFRHLDSPDALHACEVFAAQTDRLLGILAFQYSPYNAGLGKIWWVKDSRGVDVPVVTLRYQIWWHLNQRAEAGTPAKVAREIAASSGQAPADQPRHDWAMIHAWSYFKEHPGTDEAAENMPPKAKLTGSYEALGAVRGYDPVLWCAERLPASVRIASVEEMVWRIRMQHDPIVTAREIAAFKP